MSWRGTLTLLLLAAALLSGWSAWRQRAQPLPATAASTRSDYLLRDFEIVALNGQGQESFTLRAPRLQRNPDDRTMAIETPLFLLPDKAGQRWQVRARTGWVSADNSEVRLRGDVIANSPSGNDRPATLKTEQLNVFPDRNEATSAVLVTMTEPGTTMQGTGMRADLDSQRIQLLSEVRTRYVPTRR